MAYNECLGIVCRISIHYAYKLHTDVLLTMTGQTKPVFGGHPLKLVVSFPYLDICLLKGGEQCFVRPTFQQNNILAREADHKLQGMSAKRSGVKGFAHLHKDVTATPALVTLATDSMH